jgi:hypothetical protein
MAAIHCSCRSFEWMKPVGHEQQDAGQDPAQEHPTVVDLLHLRLLRMSAIRRSRAVVLIACPWRGGPG